MTERGEISQEAIDAAAAVLWNGRGNYLRFYQEYKELARAALEAAAKVRRAHGEDQKAMTERVMGIGPAPRTHAEFMQLFNCFKTWVLACTVVDQPRASPPWRWPPNFWWDCECGDAARAVGKKEGTA